MSEPEIRQFEKESVIFQKREVKVIRIETRTEIVKSELFNEPITRLVSFPTDESYKTTYPSDFVSPELDDFEERKELCKIIGLKSVPEKDPSSFDQLNGLFDDLSLKNVDAVKWVKSLRQGKAVK
jgi:hypothetical protein